MECPSCRSETPDISKFCISCGAALPARCPSCGSANPADAKFCLECGQKLAATPTKRATISTAAPLPRTGGSAERRQLTVMFCDLVGSTALSARLDPEDMREIIGTYHRCCAEQITKSGGFVAKYMGDGVLAYFGYPQAHEDDAERALRAGLALAEAVPKLPVHHGAAPQVRVGIASGLVVVGDLIGEGDARERGVVGDTPNLAARLQALADSGQVVISQSTRRLTGGLFEYRDLGRVALKGLTEPIQAWQVVGASTVESRFEAHQEANLTPLVGREEELELLLRRWRQAASGEGRVVLISGEPGIGKSRLTVALQERLQGEPHTRLHYFCSPHHTDSALYPTIAQLERAAGFERHHTADARFDKLASLLGPSSSGNSDLQLLAELLSIPTGDRHPPLNLTPQRKKQMTLEALLRQLEMLSRQRPVLMVYEDVHWIDPSSRELLDMTVERVARLPVMLLITFRPEFQPTWIGQAPVTALSLNRLGRREVAALVERVAGNNALPDEIRVEIAERTDGIPLFVEELTKAVLEAGAQDKDGVRTVLSAPPQGLAVPATLHASLMARLDRLGVVAKEVAQVAAAIGREVNCELMAAVAGKTDASLQAALKRLTVAGLVTCRGAAPQTTLLFKHALVRDTAYGTLLRGARRELHARIADALVSDFPDQAIAAPELIAQHLEVAERQVEAIERWQEAGNRAMRRSATTEALAHFARALALVASLPEGLPRSERELAVLLQLGLASQIAKGPASQQTGEYYKRAEEASRALGEPRQEFMAAWGLWLHFNVQGFTREALQRADRLLGLARKVHDADLEMEAHHAHIPVLAMLGDFDALRATTLEVMRRYDRSRHSENAHTYIGHDSFVCACAFYSVALWTLGFPSQAREAAHRAIDDARRVNHPFTLVHGLCHAGMTLQLLQDRDDCALAAKEIIAVAGENGFPWPLAFGRFLQGWVCCVDGNADAGSAAMLEGAMQPSNANRRPYMLSTIARVQAGFGRIDAALGSLEEALGASNDLGIFWFDAEIACLQGRCLLLQGATNAATAEAHYQVALDVARRQQAKTFELRAATSLARLWRDQEKRTEARDLLASIYGWFTEGFDTPDLKEAKALLEELS